jgi:hypothetical protein
VDMDDSFSLGQPAKRQARPARRVQPKHAAPTPKRGPHGIERTRYILGAIGLLVAAFVVWGFMHFMSSAGSEAASGQMQEIGAAQDVRAQMTGQQTIQSVEGLYAQSGSFNSITAQALKAFEPTYSYTNGPSTDPNTVSIASTASDVGLAVLSTPGRCLYAHITAAGVTYGSGTTCTGTVALKASSPSWPTPA